MPLQMKTLKEAAAELGMSETELRTMVNLGKVRALVKKGQMTFAPDELAKLKRVRKTVTESALRPAATPSSTASAAKPATPRPATPRPAARPAIKRPPPRPPMG